MKINVEKTKSLRLGISEDEQVTLGNEKIDLVGSFSYLGSIISKDGGSSEDVKSRMSKAQGVFFTVKNVWKNRKISLQTKIRILEATVMTVVKYVSEAWALQKADENLLDVFQRNCLQIVLDTRLTDRISNSRLYKKCGSIPLSGAIKKESFPPRNFVKCLISPWFLGISGKSRIFIKNLDTCVKPFLGDFTACNYPVKSLPNY